MNLRILSFIRQVGFSLRAIQVLRHIGFSEHLLTPPTNNTTILLSTLIAKESASLEYVIDIIFKTEFQQIYPAHYHAFLSLQCNLG